VRGDDEEIRKEPVRMGDIPVYLDETWKSSAAIWARFRRFGMPHEGGWSAERNVVLRVIEIFEDEAALFERHKRQTNGERSNPRNH